MLLSAVGDLLLLAVACLAGAFFAAAGTAAFLAAAGAAAFFTAGAAAFLAAAGAATFLAAAGAATFLAAAGAAAFLAAGAATFLATAGAAVFFAAAGVSVFFATGFAFCCAIVAPLFSRLIKHPVRYTGHQSQLLEQQKHSTPYPACFNNSLHAPHRPPPAAQRHE